jgi:hypothetical protein
LRDEILAPRDAWEKAEEDRVEHQAQSLDQDAFLLKTLQMKQISKSLLMT